MSNIQQSTNDRSFERGDGRTPRDLAIRECGDNSECAEILRVAEKNELLRATERNFDYFISAIKDGNIDDVKRFCHSDYINEYDKNGMTALHYACEKTNVDIMRYLLDNGSDIECVDCINQNRPIHQAVQYSHISIVNELINRGCTVNVRGGDGLTLLNYATMRDRDNIECAEILRVAEKNERLRAIELNFYYFISAIRCGNIDDVKRFCHSDYINKCDEDGMTALHRACSLDNIDIVRYLLDNGSDIECENSIDQYRPIHYAALYRHISIVNELINRGCTVNVRDGDGRTPLDYAIMGGGDNSAEILRVAEKAPEIERQMKRAIVSLNSKKEILLGEGSFGRVIRYTDDDVGNTFAVKKITRFAGTLTDDEVNDLETEILIYNKLEEHDRIVKYYGTHRDNDTIYIFMECMEGGSILDYLDEYGALTPDKIAHYTKQILHGLDFLHRNSIIHRDIRGANILRDAQDDIKLCDFGLSRFLKIETSQNIIDNVTTDCGTSYFMAPEVIRGEDYGFSADIWSLGATVVEMVTGIHPYPILGTIQAIHKISTTNKLEYATPESMTPILQSFIDQMLVPDPMERASIDALLESDFIRDAS